MLIQIMRESRTSKKQVREWRSKFGPMLSYFVPPILALTILLIVWEIWVHVAGVPVYILPGPHLIVVRLFSDIGFFAGHGIVTLTEAIVGFVLGSGVAILAATLMTYSRFIERALFPVAVLVKVTPIVAIAPLFVIWFGFGYFPKILIASLITFFPVMVNAIMGFRSVNPGALDFFDSLYASKKDIFFKLRVPSSLPYLFAAFRISIPLSVIGAVVGEWFSGDRGLGSVIIVAHNNLDMPTLFSAVISLAVMGISLTVATWYLERRVLYWHESAIVP